MSDIPEYITKELLEEALNQFFKAEDIEILTYTSTAAIPPGENYTSDLYRTSITYKTGKSENEKTISIIIKCFPQNEFIRNLVTENRFFEKEVELFTQTLPAINDILGDLGPITGKCVYSMDQPYKVIIFEDLCPMGFKMLDRHEGYDLDHCLLTVENIAKLHAASLVLLEKDPILITKYTDGIFKETEAVAQWIESGFNSLIKSCAKWPGYEKYSAKLKAMGDKIVTKSFAAGKPKLGSLNVLNHGDVWVNNFMLSYTPEGKLKDFRFVDFQIIVYSSPAIDLHFFFATTPTVEVKKKHFHEVFDHYYSNLLATLTKLHYSLERMPTRTQLWKEFGSRASYGLLVSVTNFPLIKAPRREDSSFDDLMENDAEGSFRSECYSHEEYRKHMEFLLPFYDELGALDNY